MERQENSFDPRHIEHQRDQYQERGLARPRPDQIAVHRVLK